MRKYLLLTFMLVWSVAALYAQSRNVTGTVRDATTGSTIPGVTVRVEGSTTATQTDAAGRFSIEASPGDEVVVSFLGYETYRVTLGDQTTLDVQLQYEDTTLDEVVVIGYGTQRKVDLTGAISSIRSEEIVKQPAMSAMQSVQGKVAGLNIVATENPGSAPNVIIRGLGTALGGRNPLYIVDGLPVENINNINPADIESMDVLKDASSASIYGLRAANGVVIVTTKRGRAGAFTINYEAYAGTKSVLNQVKMANASQFITYFNENTEAIGGSNTLKPNQPFDTDWFGELLETGTVFNNTVNLSGGSEHVDYFVSYNNLTENGILDGQRFTRNTIRNNNTYKFLDNRLRFNQTANVTFTQTTPKPLGAFNAAYRQAPIFPVMYPSGRYGGPFVNRTTGMSGYEGAPGDEIGRINSIGNPIYEVLRNNERQNTVTLQGGFEGEFKITDYLKINSRVGATKYYYRDRNFVDILDGWLNADPTRTEQEFNDFRTQNPQAISYAYNSLTMNRNETLRWVWENFITFQKTFDKHNVEATLGMSRERFGSGDRLLARGYDVPAQEQYWSINFSNRPTDSAYPRAVEQNAFTPRALASYFGRVQYNYDSRYYFTATVRRDGSSVFRQTGQYWGTFPAFGAGWTISNESFMQDAEWLNFLKLRANWGILGNQDIPVNVSTLIVSPGTNGGAAENTSNYVFGPNQDLVYGAAFGTPALPLGWEKTQETGVGLDFGFLNNRLSGSVDYYHKLNTNTIFEIRPTLSSPFQQNFFDHGGKVLNQGIEMAVNWNASVNEDFNYSIGLNYSYNKNEVTEVKPAYDGAIGGSLANGEITKQLRAGQPIYGWWMFEADGVWQNNAEIAEGATVGTPIPGHLRYKDQNGDGVIDNRDRIFFGSYLPKSTYGINLGLNYKAFDASIHGFGVAGNRVYNALKGTRIDGGENISLETFENRWTGEGSTNEHPGAARDTYASSYYLESGAFFRINNATLGYTFKNLYSNTSRLRVYITAQNPFMFTNYSGFSPEIVGEEQGVPAKTAGIELSAYPTTRNFLFGINFQF